MLGRQGLGPGPHRRGQQQLAAGRRPEAVGRGLQAALVGDLEGPDLLDRVAPELDPERMLLSRREDIQDAAADGDIAALFHQVGPRVADVDQPDHDLVQVGLLAGPQHDRLQLAEPADDRLQQAADRGGDDRQRS